MNSRNVFLSQRPFDLYELILFAHVVDTGSFTRAAEKVGLTQSALSRQIQALESRLNVSLLDRTTRTLRPTAAGKALRAEAQQLINHAQSSYERIQSEYATGPKHIKLGVSTSTAMAHMPGLLQPSLKHHPDYDFQVWHEPGQSLLERILEDEIDVAVLCPPKRLSKQLRVVHRFSDRFTLIAPTELSRPYTELAHKDTKGRKRWLLKQRWLLPDPHTATGQRITDWLAEMNLNVEPSIMLNSSDMVVNLVSMGMGISLVPIRALATFGSRRPVQRLDYRKPFVRELVAIVRTGRRLPSHLKNFIEEMLF